MRAGRLLTYVPCLYAIVVSLLHWLTVRGQPLDADAESYLLATRSFTPLSLVSGVREPLWIALLTLPVKLLGAYPDVVRFLGVAGFVVLVLAFQSVTRRLYGTVWATLGTVILASSPWLIFQSTRGLREEASAGLVLLFALGVISGARSARRSAALGAGAGMIALLRWDTLLLTLPTLLLALARWRAPRRQWAASVAAFAAAVSPFLLGNRIVSGDALAHLSWQPAFFRNLEFRDQPGFPTSAELEKDAFAGPRISWTEYLFKVHTPSETAARSLSGVAFIAHKVTAEALFYPDRVVLRSRSVRGVLHHPKVLLPWALSAAGVLGGLLYLRGAAWPLGVLVFLALAQFAPIAYLMDPRLALPVVPLLTLGTMEVVATCVGRSSAKQGAAAARA